MIDHTLGLLQPVDLLGEGKLGEATPLGGTMPLHPHVAPSGREVLGSLIVAVFPQLVEPLDAEQILNQVLSSCAL